MIWSGGEWEKRKKNERTKTKTRWPKKENRCASVVARVVVSLWFVLTHRHFQDWPLNIYCVTGCITHTHTHTHSHGIRRTAMSQVQKHRSNQDFWNWFDFKIFSLCRIACSIHFFSRSESHLISHFYSVSSVSIAPFLSQYFRLMIICACVFLCLHSFFNMIAHEMLLLRFFCYWNCCLEMSFGQMERVQPQHNTINRSVDVKIHRISFGVSFTFYPFSIIKCSLAIDQKIYYCSEGWCVCEMCMPFLLYLFTWFSIEI